jgi:hypothetical protein
LSTLCVTVFTGPTLARHDDAQKRRKSREGRQRARFRATSSACSQLSWGRPARCRWSRPVLGEVLLLQCAHIVGTAGRGGRLAMRAEAAAAHEHVTRRMPDQLEGPPASAVGTRGDDRDLGTVRSDRGGGRHESEHARSLPSSPGTNGSGTRDLGHDNIRRACGLVTGRSPLWPARHLGLRSTT